MADAELHGLIRDTVRRLQTLETAIASTGAPGSLQLLQDERLAVSTFLHDLYNSQRIRTDRTLLTTLARGAGEARVAGEVNNRISEDLRSDLTAQSRVGATSTNSSVLVDDTIIATGTETEDGVVQPADGGEDSSSSAKDTADVSRDCDSSDGSLRSDQDTEESSVGIKVDDRTISSTTFPPASSRLTHNPEAPASNHDSVKVTLPEDKADFLMPTIIALQDTTATAIGSTANETVEPSLLTVLGASFDCMRRRFTRIEFATTGSSATSQDDNLTTVKADEESAVGVQSLDAVADGSLSAHATPSDDNKKVVAISVGQAGAQSAMHEDGTHAQSVAAAIPEHASSASHTPRAKPGRTRLHTQDTKRLSHETRSVVTRECTACMDLRPESETTQLRSCNHILCRGCVIFLFEHAVKVREMAKCCNRALQQIEIRNFLPADVLRDYIAVLNEIKAGKQVPCYGCEENLPENKGADDEYRVCTACKTETCTICKETKHDGFCGGAGDHDKQTEELAEREGWKRCPVCKIMISRTDGCNHMR